MGKLPVTDGGDLGVGFRDYLSAEAIPYQRSLCRIISDLRFFAELADWQSVAVGNCANHRTHVSTFHIFMITDPKTTVRSKTGQCITVICVALLEMVLRLNQVVYAPFYALFIVGPSAMLIEMWLDSRRASAAGAAVAA